MQQYDFHGFLFSTFGENQENVFFLSPSYFLTLSLFLFHTFSFYRMTHVAPNPGMETLQQQSGLPHRHLSRRYSQYW